eukprot:14598743-Alexandrium_andersonii.AAC.1
MKSGGDPEQLESSLQRSEDESTDVDIWVARGSKVHRARKRNAWRHARNPKRHRLCKRCAAGRKGD